MKELLPIRLVPAVVLTLIFCASFLTASSRRPQNKVKLVPRTAAETQGRSALDDISGMYTFTRDGEFVQITVEDGLLSGFVSRYGDGETDKDEFLDQFFSQASLDGNRISFKTKAVHGDWFEFTGQVSRGAVATREKEGYYLIKGTLKRYSSDADQHVTVQSREITLRSFPDDAGDVK